jgi:endonuclease/exonuclease/phosphatase family metal-dependent hydrolase
MKKSFKFLLRFIALLVVVAVVFFFWASSPTLEEKEYAKLIELEHEVVHEKDSIFSIVTYNIGYLSGMTNNLPVAKPKELFDENLEKVLSETAKVNPDIIAFQEIDFNASRSYHVNQQNKIADLGYNYIAETVNWDETYVPFPYWPPSMHFGKVVSGQSILSKYPLKDHERIVLERVADNPFYRDALYLDRLAQVATVEINGKDVVLINTHLEAFDKKTREKQLAAIITLFQKHAATNPTILLGDFNSDPSYKDAAIKKVFELPNVGNAAFSKEKYELTFNSKNPFERLDYIFYTTNSIEYVSGKVLKQFGEASDHLPVEMQFKLKE